jgi:DNA polymerase-3 subunit alpha
VLEKNTTPIADLAIAGSRKSVRVGGIIASIKKIITKTGRPMLFAKLEDLTGKIEVVVFPSVIERDPTLFQENKIVFISGRTDMRDNVPKVICEEIEELMGE